MTPDGAKAEDDLLGGCYRRIKEHDLELQELHLHRPSLEELFFELTTRAEAAAVVDEGGTEEVA